MPINSSSRRLSSLATLLLLAGCIGTDAIDANGSQEEEHAGVGPIARSSDAPGAGSATPNLPPHHAPPTLEVAFDGAEGQQLRAAVVNLSTEPVEVHLVAALRGQVGVGKVDLGSVELGPEQSKTVTIDNARLGFSEVLEDGQTAGLSIGATATLSDGRVQRDSFRVYIDSDFNVKTPEEVRDIKNRLPADEAAAKNPFRFAGQKVVPGTQPLHDMPEPLSMEKPVPEFPSGFETDFRAVEPIGTRASGSSGVSQATTSARGALGEGAATVVTRLCAFASAGWQDPDVGDWLTSGYWTVQGLLYGIKDENGNSVQSGYLGWNGAPSGCTSSITLEQGKTYTFVLNSWAQLPTGGGGTNQLRGWDANNQYQTETATVTITASASHNVFFDFDDPTVIAAYAAATGLYMLRDGRGAGSYYYDLRTGQPDSLYDGTIRIATGHEDQKFVVAHELGHAIMGHNMPVFMAKPKDYSVTGSAGCTSPANNAEYGSEEHMHIALTEGFATFVGAATFNERNETNCQFWHGITMNCETSQPAAGLPLAKHRTVCGGDSGRGVQWDWVRQLWDVYQETSFPSLMAFLREADGSAHNSANTYILLNDAAQGRDVESVWNDMKVANGVKICADGIGNSSHTVCCAASCGTCAGTGCGSRPGGPSACCKGHIEAANNTCTGSNAPCVLP